MIKACQPLFLLKSVLFIRDAFMSVAAVWTNKFQVGCLEVMLMRNTGGDTNNAHVHVHVWLSQNGNVLTINWQYVPF